MEILLNSNFHILNIKNEEKRIYFENVFIAFYKYPRELINRILFSLAVQQSGGVDQGS